MSTLHIDVDGKAEEISNALRKGIHKGLNESGQWLLERGEDRAQRHIFNAGREWRKELKQGFTTEKNQFSRSNRWLGEIENVADHAEINENGLPPGTAPPIQALLPWIDDKVVPNAEARSSAERSNIENWDPDLRAAAERYGKAQVITAFAIKEGLEANGYDGIQFMKKTESYLNSVGPRLVKQKVEKHINRELRKRGVK